MNPLCIQIDANQTAFRPGDALGGFVRWKFDQRPGPIDLRLIWFTEGPGSEDVGVVDSLIIDDPLPSDSRPFHFRLPLGPYSYAGRLFRIRWALELLISGQKEFIRSEFILSPVDRPLSFAESQPNRH